MPMVQTFVDRIDTTEKEISDLVRMAENLANRLVGYADTPEPAYPGDMPANGILHEIGDRAGRMAVKIGDVRRSLQRISDALPPESIASTGKAYIGH